MDWSSLLSALLGGFLALSGQAVQARVSRGSELRQRGEGAALAMRDLLQQIESLYMAHTDEYGQLDPDTERTREQLVAKLRGEALLVPDLGVRERILDAAALLSDSFAISRYGGVSEQTANMQICRWLEAVLGCYLRREGLASDPEYMVAYRSAIADAYAAWEEQYQWQREVERGDG